MVRAVFFDAFGVLVKEWGAWFENRLQQLWRVSPDEFYPPFLKRRELMFSGAFDFHTLLDDVAADLMRPRLTVEERNTLHPDQIELNTELYDVAKNLKRRGITVGIISNAWRPSSEEARERRRMIYDATVFDPILLSDEVGLQKPDPRIFELARDRVGIPYSEMVFIDDRQENVGPAKALGIQAFLFVDNTLLREELRGIGLIIE
jgi:epoxide hydrolase-like predicted phosphatase